MLVEHLLFRQAFGACRQHILLADFFQKRVLGQHGSDRKAARHHGRHRQRNMPEVIHHLAHRAQFIKVRRGQPAQREPLQLPAKDDQQRHAQHKARNGIADQNQDRGGQIKARACTHCLGNAQRHGDQIADEKRPQSQTDGDRQLLFDQRPDTFVLEKAGAQIKARKLAQHLHKALQGRLVKAIERLDFFQPFRVHPLPAAIAHGCTFCTTARTGLGLCQILLHRATGHKLDDDKGQQQHAQESGNHEQNTFENIGKHGGFGSRLRFGRRRGLRRLSSPPGIDSP